MKKKTGCDCGQRLSRRQVLQAGLAAAAVGAMGGVDEALAESHAKSATEAQGMRAAAGVRAVDIHCHYFPEAYFKVFNEDGKRVNAEYHMTDEGFFNKTPNSRNTASPITGKS